jgi:hypothetical protein
MRKILLLVAISAALVGCSQTSPMRHSYHYASHQTGLVSGTYVSNPNTTAKMNLQAFETVYNQGKADRAAGVTESVALHNTAGIKEANQQTRIKNTFTNAPQAKATIEQSDPRDAQLWAEELSKAYLDGYHGIE